MKTGYRSVDQIVWNQVITHKIFRNIRFQMLPKILGDSPPNLPDNYSGINNFFPLENFQFVQMGINQRLKIRLVTKLLISLHLGMQHKQRVEQCLMARQSLSVVLLRIPIYQVSFSLIQSILTFLTPQNDHVGMHRKSGTITFFTFVSIYIFIVNQATISLKLNMFIDTKVAKVMW